MYSIHFSPSSSSLRAKFPLKTFLFTPLDFINFLLPRSSEFSPRIGNCSPAERSSFATPHWSVLIRWRLSKKLNYFRSWQSEIKEIIICPRVSLLEYDACDTLPAELIQITEYSVFQPQTLWRKYVRTSGIFQLNFPDTFWAFFLGGGGGGAEEQLPGICLAISKPLREQPGNRFPLAQLNLAIEPLTL